MGVDTGENIGSSLPSSNISVVSQIGNTQIACGMDNLHYIRYYWGTWKSWTKI